MQEIAYAKINLALHVRERQADGYHRIETLFAFAQDGDRLIVEPGDELRLKVVGPFANALSGGNLVLQAAEALRSRYDVSEGASLTLDKRLPVASGIGGGSADAAATLRLLDRWWGLCAADAELLEIAAQLGADVPACLRSETARGTGRGDELGFAGGEDIADLPLLLVNPGVPVATGPVFSGWDGADRGPLSGGSPLEAALKGRNDLEPPAISIAPAIRDVLAQLQQMPGLLLARMSGSGATCFALFENEADRNSAAERLSVIQPGWWQLRSCLR